MENVADTENLRVRRRGELLSRISKLISGLENDELSAVVDAMVEKQFGGKDVLNRSH